MSKLTNTVSSPVSKSSSVEEIEARKTVFPPPQIHTPAECMAVARAHKDLTNLKALTSQERHEMFVAKTYLVDNHTLFTEAELQEATVIFSRHMKLVADPGLTETLIKQALDHKKAFPFLLDFGVLKKAKSEVYLSKYLLLVNDRNDKTQMSHYYGRYQRLCDNMFLSTGKRQSTALIEIALERLPENLALVKGWSEEQKINWLEKNPGASFAFLKNQKQLTISKELAVAPRLTSTAAKLFINQAIKKLDFSESEEATTERFQLAQKFFIYPELYHYFEATYPAENLKFLAAPVVSVSVHMGKELISKENTAQYIVRNIRSPQLAQKFFDKYNSLVSKPCDYVEQYYKKEISFFEFAYRSKSIDTLLLYPKESLNQEEKKMLFALSMDEFVNYQESRGKSFEEVLRNLSTQPAEFVLELKPLVSHQFTLPSKTQEAWIILVQKKELELQLTAPRSESPPKPTHKI